MCKITPVARIVSDFPSKFGVPRQASLVPSLEAVIRFEGEYRQPDAIRGIDEFSHLWLIWQFSLSHRDGVSATVRPPRLGGNTRVGVFASRSPFRPNPIGLSSVRLLSVDYKNVELRVGGADLVDGTPIFDIKPYIPSADCHTDASGGFTDRVEYPCLEVEIPLNLESVIPVEKRAALRGVLAQDPRPSYQKEGRVYGMAFGQWNIRFTVKDRVLTVVEITGR